MVVISQIVNRYYLFPTFTMLKPILLGLLCFIYSFLYILSQAGFVYRGNSTYTFTNQTEETMSITPLYKALDFWEYGIEYGEYEKRTKILDTLSYRIFKPYHINKIFPLRHLGSSIKLHPGEKTTFYINEEPIRQQENAMVLFVQIKEQHFYMITDFWENDQLNFLEELYPATPGMVGVVQDASRIYLLHSILDYFFLFLFIYFPYWFLKSVYNWLFGGKKIPGLLKASEYNLLKNE